VERWTGRGKIVRFGRLLDLKRNILKEFDVGGDLRSLSASSLVLVVYSTERVPAVHTSIVLFQCHVSQCLASWGPWPPCLPPKSALATGGALWTQQRSSRVRYEGRRRMGGDALQLGR